MCQRATGDNSSGDQTLGQRGESKNHLQGGVKWLEKELWSLGLGTAISDGVITFSDGHNLVIVEILANQDRRGLQ